MTYFVSDIAYLKFKEESGKYKERKMHLEKIKEKIYEENLPKDWKNDNYVMEVALHFLNGFTIYKKKWKYVVPIEWYAIIFTVCSVGLGLVCYYNSDNLVIVFDAIHYSLHMIVLNSCAYAVIRYRKEYAELNVELDKWFHYRQLNKENLQVRKEAQIESHKVTFPYNTGMYMCNTLFCLSPMVKLLITSDRSNMLDFLMFPCYFPVPLDTWWGFAIGYLFEVACSSCAFTLFARLASYMVTACVHIGYQLKLLGLALLTIEERSKKITESKGHYVDSPNWKAEYVKTLEEEIKVCVIHLQYLHKLAKDVIRLFIATTTTTYSGGMWIVCFSGVLLATMQEETALLVKFFMMLIAELISMYMYSIASEYLLSSFEQTKNSVYNSPWYNLPNPCRKSLLIVMNMLIKVPSLKTVIGYNTNMENLSNILNASYTYFSMIIAMRK